MSEANSTVTVTLVRKRGWTGSVRVRVVSKDATATASLDYDAYDADVMFKDGENQTSFQVQLNLDTRFEFPNEIFQLTIKEAEVTVNGSSAHLRMEQSNISTCDVLITDDGDAGQIGFSSISYFYPETGSGFQGTFPVTIKRSNMSGDNVGDLAVSYTTAGDKTASKQGVDFSDNSGTVYFFGGIAERTFNVRLSDDDLFEFPNEEFSVMLTDISYNGQTSSIIAYSNQNAVVTILDDGDFGTVDFRTPDERFDWSAGHERY